MCVILLSHEKEWDNAICSNMDGPRDYQTKWSKPDRERWMSYDITYMWNLRRKKRYKWIYLQNRCISIENKLMLFKGEGAEDWLLHTPIYEKDKQQGPTM